MEIYAKSDPRITLVQHVNDGLRILECLKSAFPKTPAIARLPELWDWLRLCVVFHDTGKGHLAFQQLLLAQENQWKKQRHELFSLSFVQACLSSHPGFTEIIRVVAGHHRTMEWLIQHIETEYPEMDDFINEFNFVAVKDILDMLKKEYSIDIPEAVQPLHPFKTIAAYRRSYATMESSYRYQLLLMTGAFKQCDHLSSAFVDAVPIVPIERFSFLDRKLETLKAKGADFFSHQKKAAQTSNSVVITAPTGSGKTETAMLWARTQLETCGQGRIFYILPFTASINAMWRRLGNDQDGLGETHVGMLHGNIDAVLYEQFFEEAGDVKETTDNLKKLKEAFRSLETPIKIVTPFQLLKHIFGLKGFEKGIFEMSGGYFIFDEIHAYDPAVFAQIVVLIEFVVKELQAKVLIMTATLPHFLKQELKKVCDFDEIHADAELYQRFKRHELNLIDRSIVEEIPSISRSLQANKKVLVVCNTVLQAQSVYEAILNTGILSSEDSLLLHSAFTGEDRSMIESRLKNNPPKLLVGTQAIEVSLDIDYDMIYTELAPFDALLQRFGRVNRHRFWFEAPKPCHVCIVRNNKDKFVYKNEEVITRTVEVLKKISTSNNGIIQEDMLQEYIDFVYPDFSKDDKEKYETTLIYLKKSGLEMLIPMEQSKQTEEDFYKMFDGEKVVPGELYKRYTEYLKSFDFIGAQRLKVNIRRGEFKRWIRNGILQKEIFVLEKQYGKPGDILSIETMILNLPYSSRSGLQKNADPISISFFDDRIL